MIFRSAFGSGVLRRSRWGDKPTGVVKPCRQCSKEFYVMRCRADLGHFCSRSCYHAYRRRPDVRLAQFWDQVDKAAPGGCWLWTGWKINSGYGETRIHQRRITCHRLSYELANGAIPAGKHVLHRCNVPACINPDHLYLGTDQDNTNDRRKAGTVAVGERTKRHVLTTADVLKIRAEYRPGERGYHDRKSNRFELAARFGVAASTIVKAATGASWSHLK